MGKTLADQEMQTSAKEEGQGYTPETRPERVDEARTVCYCPCCSKEELEAWESRNKCKGGGLEAVQEGGAGRRGALACDCASGAGHADAIMRTR